MIDESRDALQLEAALLLEYEMMRIETYFRQSDLMFHANDFRVGDCFQLGLDGRSCARETEPPRRRQFAVPQAAISQPVDWYPCGAAAFGRAKELDRPILLDVGAVWCPWCDLMDRDT
jgi:hypothetical protein